ncbi:hypothetical protein [Peptostreptococcus faecalis]|nr:hypothetical protein [Peptostreptococcus faecalis]
MIAKLHKTKIYPDNGTVDKNKYEIMYVGEGKDRYESDRIASSKFLL